MLCGVVVVVVGIVLRWEVITTFTTFTAFTTVIEALRRGTGRAVGADVFDEAAASFFGDFFGAIFVADGHRL